MTTTKKIRGPEITFQSEEEKAMIERAAFFTGTNPTSFIRHAALEYARLRLEEERKIILSNKDFEAFLMDLEDAAEPNQALKRLMKR